MVVRSSPSLTAVLPTVAILAAAAVAGSLFGWYEQVRWYDEAVHAGFGFAATAAIGAWLSRTVLAGSSASPGLLVLMLVLIGLGVGSIWEVLEFGYDHLSGPRSIIQGKFDTVVDLLCDAAGALAASVWVARSMS